MSSVVMHEIIVVRLSDIPEGFSDVFLSTRVVVKPFHYHFRKGSVVESEVLVEFIEGTYRHSPLPGRIQDAYMSAVHTDYSDMDYIQAVLGGRRDYSVADTAGPGFSGSGHKNKIAGHQPFRGASGQQ